MSVAEYIKTADLTGTVQVVANLKEYDGINMANWKKAAIQIIPSDGANPVVELFWWSESASKWVADYTPVKWLARGVNVPWETIVECKSRKMLAAVTGGCSGSQKVKVYVAGIGRDR